MDQTLSERKRIILQRSAETRAAVKQSLVSTVEAVRGVYVRLKEPRPYVKAGLALGGGVVGLMIGKRLVQAIIGHRALVGCPAMNDCSGTGHALGWLLIQVVSSLLLPYMRERIRAQELGDSIRRLRPSRIFFRWLGLEK